MLEYGNLDLVCCLFVFVGVDDFVFLLLVLVKEVFVVKNLWDDEDVEE